MSFLLRNVSNGFENVYKSFQFSFTLEKLNSHDSHNNCPISIHYEKKNRCCQQKVKKLFKFPVNNCIAVSLGRFSIESLVDAFLLFHVLDKLFHLITRPVWVNNKTFSSPISHVFENEISIISYRASTVYLTQCRHHFSFCFYATDEVFQFFFGRLFRDFTFVWHITFFDCILCVLAHRKADKRGNNYTFIWFITQFDLKSARGRTKENCEVIKVLFWLRKNENVYSIECIPAIVSCFVRAERWNLHWCDLRVSLGWKNLRLRELEWRNWPFFPYAKPREFSFIFSRLFLANATAESAWKHQADSREELWNFFCSSWVISWCSAISWVEVREHWQFGPARIFVQLGANSAVDSTWNHQLDGAESAIAFDQGKLGRADHCWLEHNKDSRVCVHRTLRWDHHRQNQQHTSRTNWVASFQKTDHPQSRNHWLDFQDKLRLENVLRLSHPERGDSRLVLFVAQSKHVRLERSSSTENLQHDIRCYRRRGIYDGCFR